MDVNLGLQCLSDNQVTIDLSSNILTLNKRASEINGNSKNSTENMKRADNEISNDYVLTSTFMSR